MWFDFPTLPVGGLAKGLANESYSQVLYIWTLNLICTSRPSHMTRYSLLKSRCWQDHMTMFDHNMIKLSIVKQETKNNIWYIVLYSIVDLLMSSMTQWHKWYVCTIANRKIKQHSYTHPAQHIAQRHVSIIFAPIRIVHHIAQTHISIAHPIAHMYVHIARPIAQAYAHIAHQIAQPYARTAHISVQAQTHCHIVRTHRTHSCT